MLRNKRKSIILILLAVFIISVSFGSVYAADSNNDSSVNAKQVS